VERSLSTSANTKRVTVRTLCISGGVRITPGEHELPASVADGLCRDGLAVAVEPLKRQNMAKRREGLQA
jgi:hypothetical protein